MGCSIGLLILQDPDGERNRITFSFRKQERSGQQLLLNLFSEPKKHVEEFHCWPLTQTYFSDQMRINFEWWTCLLFPVCVHTFTLLNSTNNSTPEFALLNYSQLPSATDKWDEQNVLLLLLYAIHMFFVTCRIQKWKELTFLILLYLMGSIYV